MEQFLKSYAIDSLNIQNIIGEDMFFSSISYRMANGKLLVEGIEKKNRFSDTAPKLIFVVDLEKKKLLSTVTDPVKNHLDLTFNLWNDSTLVLMHSLTNEKVYLINIYNHKVDERQIHFDESANRPHTIDANGEQLLMTNNVYGFAVADLNTLQGKVLRIQVSALLKVLFLIQ